MICNTRSISSEGKFWWEWNFIVERIDERNMYSLSLNDQYFQQFSMTLGKWYSFTQLYSASTGAGKHNDGEPTLKPMDEEN